MLIETLTTTWAPRILSLLRIITVGKARPISAFGEKGYVEGRSQIRHFHRWNHFAMPCEADPNRYVGGHILDGSHGQDRLVIGRDFPQPAITFDKNATLLASRHVSVGSSPVMANA